jgi:HSP20 family protein
MLTRWDPFRGFTSIEEEFDRLVGQAFSKNAWVPALDIREKEDAFLVTVDLPGLEPEQVDVSFEDGILTIRGAREFRRDENEEGTYHRIERSYGSFARTVRLPRTADAEKIEASFDTGVLTVRVPKREEAKPRTIEVKAVEKK